MIKEIIIAIFNFFNYIAGVQWVYIPERNTYNPVSDLDFLLSGFVIMATIATIIAITALLCKLTKRTYIAARSMNKKEVLTKCNDFMKSCRKVEEEKEEKTEEEDILLLEYNEKIDPLHLAKYLVNRMHEEDQYIDLLKLHHLIYLVYIVYYKILDTFIFDEKFIADKYGFKLASVQKRYSCFGSSIIPKNEEEFIYDEKEGEFVTKSFEFLGSESLKQVIESCITNAKKYDTYQLTRMIHQDPIWKKVYLSTPGGTLDKSIIIDMINSEMFNGGF